MGKSKIEWTEKVWNPVRGCSKVSEGCRNCYAMRQAHRFSNPGGPYEGLTKRAPGKGQRPQWTGEVRCVEELLEKPLRWKRGCRIFVNSMSDLFHPEVPFEFVDQVFAVMALCPQHTFQVLTKRPERMREYMVGRDWGESANWAHHTFIRPLDGPMHLMGEIVPPLQNVWLGTSVENQETADERIPHLLQTPAAVRWLSMEPLLGPASLRWLLAWVHKDGRFMASKEVGTTDHLDGLRKLDWVVAGGESGPGARPMHPEWVRVIRDQCQEAGVPFFFKQWGAWKAVDKPWDQYFPNPLGTVEQRLNEIYRMARVGKKAAGRELDGRTWDEYPEALT